MSWTARQIFRIHTQPGQRDSSQQCQGRQSSPLGFLLGSFPKVYRVKSPIQGARKKLGAKRKVKTNAEKTQRGRRELERQLSQHISYIGSKRPRGGNVARSTAWQIHREIVIGSHPSSSVKHWTDPTVEPRAELNSPPDH